MAKSKTYQVERRSGAKWETAAIFKIEAGECKLAERVATPPPTEVTEDKPAEEPAASGVLVVPSANPSKKPPAKKKK